MRSTPDVVPPSTPAAEWQKADTAKKPRLWAAPSHEQTFQCRRRSGFGALQFFGSSVDVATPGRSLELALWFAKLLGPEVAIHAGDCARERANRRWPRFLAIHRRFRMPLPRGTFLLPAAFSSYASGPVRLAPRGWLRSGMARDCRGCRHGPVRAVRPRLDPGGGHRGAVEETGGLTTARCSCGAALSGARVLC